MMNKLLAAIWRPISRRFDNSPSTDDLAILKGRDAKPSHYLLEIKSFSELIENPTTRTIIGVFEAGGYKWDVYIYLKGAEEFGGEGYISMYLQVNSFFLPNGWEVNAIFNLFIYNQYEDKYFGFRDPKERRFHLMNNEWGCAKLIDFETFKNPSNGFLVNNRCIFGAEVFVIEKNKCFAESLTTTSFRLETYKHSWTIDDFSKKQAVDKFYESDIFFVEEHKWRILLNPNHKYCGKRSISVGIELDTSTFVRNWKMIVTCTFRIINHNDCGHYEESDIYLFSWTPDKDTCDNKFCRFMAPTELQNPEMNYIVDDSLTIEVEINEIGLYSPHESMVINHANLTSIFT